jgi:phosphatidylglycerophosphate synthase
MTRVAAPGPSIVPKADELATEAEPTRPGAAPRAWILTSDAPGPDVFGLSGEARLARSLARLGIAFGTGQDVPAPAESGTTAIFRADWLYDDRLVTALCGAQSTLLLSRDGRAVAAHVPDAALAAARRALLASPPHEALDGAWRRTGPDQLVPAYSHELRKRSPALLEPLAGSSPRELEQRLFDASYKGITDLVTRYLWPPLALPAVRACARVGISPNVVTVTSWLLVLLSGWYFATGRFGPGLVAAWLMTFLDTVDGKLARVTLRSSRIGHVLDHGLDILHPPFWWAAFGLALPSAPWTSAATAVAVVGYWLHRLVEGLFLAFFKIEIHAWRQLDARFRLITTRRNPNLILLSVGLVAGRPDLGFAALAVWTVLSIAFHTVRLAQAALEVKHGHTVHSEYQEGAPAPAGSELSR